MRKSASEIINDLEVRIARLEKSSARVFTLEANYHTVYQPYTSRYLQGIPREEEWFSKEMMVGPKKVFIPSKRPDFSNVESMVKRELIKDLKKLQKEITDVFHSGVDPTTDASFESSKNKFEWVLVSVRTEDEELSLAYVRTTDKEYRYTIAPGIRLRVLNTRGGYAKAGYLFDYLRSELGYRTVRV
jgi:hypothetical protein